MKFAVILITQSKRERDGGGEKERYIERWREGREEEGERERERDT